MPTITPSSGGGGAAYTPPTGREIFAADPVTIANNATTSLTWNGPTGTALLDISTLTLPSVVTAGIYAITVEILGSGLTAGGWFRGRLGLDSGGDNAIVIGHALATATDTDPALALALTYYIPSGGTIVVQVTNHDGVAARDFLIDNAAVQRIT